MSTPRLLGLIFAGCAGLYAVSLVLQTWFFEHTQSRYVSAAYLAQALAEASLVRRHVEMYHAERGELPEDNAALGLGPPSSFEKGALERLEVRNGHIVLTMDQDDMDGAVAVLRVAHSRSGVGSALDWHCESADLSARFLETAAIQCEHVEAVVLSEPAAVVPEAVVHSTESLVDALHLRRKRLAKTIIRSGVNLNVAHHGLYPLEMAIEAGDGKMVDLMLANGADPNQPIARRDDLTMIGFASQSHQRSARILRALIKAGGNIEARDSAGRTPLMLAARAGNVTLVEALLAAGAEIDAIDHRGNKAANHAATHGRTAAVYTRLVSEKNKRSEIIVILPERSD